MIPHFVSVVNINLTKNIAILKTTLHIVRITVLKECSDAISVVMRIQVAKIDHSGSLNLVVQSVAHHWDYGYEQRHY